MRLLPWQGDPCLSSVASSLILQERYRCFLLLSLPRIVLNLKNVFFSYFINKNVMLDHPRRSWCDPPRKMRPHPQQVLPLKTHDADSLQQRELVKLYFLCLYYENSSLLLVPKLWNSVIIWHIFFKVYIEMLIHIPRNFLSPVRKAML